MNINYTESSSKLELEMQLVALPAVFLCCLFSTVENVDGGLNQIFLLSNIYGKFN